MIVTSLQPPMWSEPLKEKSNSVTTTADEVICVHYLHTTYVVQKTQSVERCLQRQVRTSQVGGYQKLESGESLYSVVIKTESTPKIVVSRFCSHHKHSLGSWNLVTCKFSFLANSEAGRIAES